MTGSSPELAEIVREYAPAFLRRYGRVLSRQHWRALRAIIACRTAELGGRKYRCNHCSRECYIYNPCRNRHCPKCQAKARADWTEAREAELLPIPYFHIVFTLPQQLASLGLQNKRIVYDMLFKSASRTLQVLAADPKHLGARIGILAVLHTWGQTLIAHPHVHCIVTGGGISPDGQRWIPCKQSKRSKKEFFIHVDVLSSFFRKRFLRALNRAYRQGKLRFGGKTAHLADPREFKQWTRELPDKWVVYAKRPFRRTSRLVRYLARYTHRVAISNHRLLSMENGQVTFSYKDYADGNKAKTMRLTATEFLRRFMMHVLPSGFIRIRHYGFLANRCRKEQLELCRSLLGVPPRPGDADDATAIDEALPNDHEQPRRCPACKVGELYVVYEIPAPWVRRLPVRLVSSSGRSPPLEIAV